MSDKNVWSLDVPIEKSRYYFDGKAKHLTPKKDKSFLPENPVIDLFSGAGGFSAGLSMLDYDVILGVDIHEPSIKTFQHNHKHSHAILGDIREVDNNTLKEVIKLASKGVNIELITAGIPCQGFSIANRKQSDDDERNFLFKEFLRVVNLVKPNYIIVENVATMKAAKKGMFVNEIIKKLDSYGYNVETKILNASNYKVPQNRERIIFLGAKKTLNAPIIWPKFKNNKVTVWEALSDLPKLKAGESKNKYNCDPVNEFQKTMRDGCNVLKNHKAPNHQKSTLDRIKNTKPGEPMYDNFNQRIRLHPNKQAPTIISGGIRPQFQYGHPSQIRGLTVRERARLQSFPDNFEFVGGVVQGRVLTGQAVPPLMAKALGESILLSKKINEFRKLVFKWYENNGREFPWRNERTPYKVLVSEILLRKTRAENVAKVFQNFIEKFSDIEQLEKANINEIKEVISSLGLQSIRSNNLKEIAEIIVNDYNCKIPEDKDALLELPGVGRYTANAIICFGFEKKAPLLDVNIERILKEFFNKESEKQLHREDDLWEFVDFIIPDTNFIKFNYALLDFGSM